jgi:hypothetical protein
MSFSACMSAAAAAGAAGVCSWHFEQYLEEGVFIPGGCPHQVRNLMSCSKVGVCVPTRALVAEAVVKVEAVSTLSHTHSSLCLSSPDRAATSTTPGRQQQ